MHSHTQHITPHTERGQRKKEGEREKRKHMFHVFFVCDGVGAVDLPQRVHIIRFSLQFKALFSNVDVIQHVKKCMKLQREAKNMDTLWKVKAFSAIQRPAARKRRQKRQKRRREDEREEKKRWRDDKGRERGEKMKETETHHTNTNRTPTLTAHQHSPHTHTTCTTPHSTT